MAYKFHNSIHFVSALIFDIPNAVYVPMIIYEIMTPEIVVSVEVSAENISGVFFSHSILLKIISVGDTFHIPLLALLHFQNSVVGLRSSV